RLGAGDATPSTPPGPLALRRAPPRAAAPRCRARDAVGAVRSLRGPGQAPGRPRQVRALRAGRLGGRGPRPLPPRASRGAFAGLAGESAMDRGAAERVARLAGWLGSRRARSFGAG